MMVAPHVSRSKRIIRKPKNTLPEGSKLIRGSSKMRSRLSQTTLWNPKRSIIALRGPFWRLVGALNKYFGGSWRPKSSFGSPTSAKTPPQRLPRESKRGLKRASKTILMRLCWKSPNALKFACRKAKIECENRWLECRMEWANPRKTFVFPMFFQ